MTGNLPIKRGAMPLFLCYNKEKWGVETMTTTLIVNNMTQNAAFFATAPADNILYTIAGLITIGACLYVIVDDFKDWYKKR